MNAVVRDYQRTPAGQQWQHEVRDFVQQRATQEQQAALDAQLAQQVQEAHMHRGPVMRM